ncbi:major facilitator superfamily domain-containing protein [Tribonema minus]|uniref:Major facilitator superfamily domain-containing protein n=1 Tax=Tribonema minus TaxID=303371 RepID=A0A836CJG6_9STRA|nr:major facilitator superfamily domain-containing protein [Tribonema minus]
MSAAPHAHGEAYGPALPQLRDHVPGAQYSSVAVVFLARSAAGVCGAVAMGRALEATARTHLALSAATALACCGALLLPLAASVPALMAAVFVMDVGLGGVNCGGNTLCAWANAENPTPALNVLNGAFGLGALTGPLVMVAASNDAKRAFWAIAALSAAAALVGLLVPPPPAPPPRKAAEGGEGGGRGGGGEGGALLVMPLTAAFICLSVGAEISFGAFAVPYALGQNELYDASGGREGFRMSVTEADVLNSCFWATFTAARLLWGALALRVRPAPSLAGQLATLTAAMAMMALLPTRLSFWLGAVVYGAGMSGCFAAALAQMQEIAGGMTGAAGAWVSGGASLGPLVQLAVASRASHPREIMWTILAACIGACASMGALWAACSVHWRGAPGGYNSYSNSSAQPEYKVIALIEMDGDGAGGVVDIDIDQP